MIIVSYFLLSLIAAQIATADDCEDKSTSASETTVAVTEVKASDSTLTSSTTASPTTTPNACPDTYPNCADYAQRGMCYDPSVRGSMYVNCKGSCGIGECCKDKLTNCTAASCSTNWASCVKTCSKCDCQDEATDCSAYTSQCKMSGFEAYMQQRCKKTCGFCTA